MIALKDGILSSTRLLSGMFPYDGYLTGSPLGLQSASLLVRAVALDSRSTAIAWTAERVCITAGDCQSLIDRMQAGGGNFETAPLIFETRLMSLSRHSSPEAVLEFYDTVSPAWSSKVISDTIALAYLDLARPFVEADDQSGANYLTRALIYRPSDLYANVTLARWAERDGNTQAAIVYRKRCLRFPVEAVAPTNRQLMNYVSEAVIALIKHGFWSDEQAINVTAFLVWQANETEPVHQLIERVTSLYPHRSDWLALVEEMYARRNERSREGSVSKASDNLGILDKAADKLNQAPAFSDNYLPDVAQLLQIEPKDLKVKHNLLPQGDFENYHSGKLAGWAVADYATGPFAFDPSAALAVGPDVLAAKGMLSARIQGFWTDGSPESSFYGLVSQDKGRYGAYAVRIEPQRPYFVSGVYRTVGSEVRAGVYLGNPDIGLFDEPLSPTGGAWQSFLLMGCHAAESAQQMQLLLRVRGTGIAWFDQVEIRQVTAKTSISLCAESVKSE